MKSSKIAFVALTCFLLSSLGLIAQVTSNCDAVLPELDCVGNFGFHEAGTMTAAPNFWVEASLPNTEFVITTLNVSTIDSLDGFAFAGNKILGADADGVFDPIADFGLSPGETFCVQPLSYDLEQVRSLVGALFTGNLLGNPCCDVLPLVLSGIDPCASLTEIDITDANGVMNLNQVFELILAFNDLEEFNINGLIQQLEAINGFAGTLPSDCGGDNLPICWATENNPFMATTSSQTCCFTITDEVEHERGELLSSELVKKMSFEEIEALYADFNLPASLSPINYEIDMYKLVYYTPDARGEEMTLASGLILVPVNGPACDFATFMYAHGTSSYTSADMSELGMESQIGVPFTTNGYFSVLPDYIGLGATPIDHPHTYIHYKSSATSTVDMMRASRHWCANNGIELNGQNFLSGYSEGGYVSMAAVKEIQEFHLDEFEITAAAPGSGPYDVSGIMTDSLLGSDVFSNPFYMIYTAASYQYVYGDIYESYSDVLLPPWDELAPQVLDRANPIGSGVLQWPGYSMLKPEFLEAVLTNPNHPFRLAAAQNDLYDWAPDFPMRFFYCEADDQVPYTNSILALDAFITNGASPDEVQAVSAGPALDHPACAQPGLIVSKAYFDGFRDACAPIGISENTVDYNEVSLYPNPVTDQFTVSLSSQSDLRIYSIRLFNAQGQFLMEQDATAGDKISIATLGLPTGYIYVEVRGDKRSYIKPLFVN